MKTLRKAKKASIMVLILAKRKNIKTEAFHAPQKYQINHTETTKKTIPQLETYGKETKKGHCPQDTG